MRIVQFVLTGFVLLFLASCVTESTGPITVEEQLADEILRATITGKIIDICTNKAIEGAVISVGYDGGVAVTTSDASGSFSFGNVPVSDYEVLNGQVVANDFYTITASLVNFNQAQSDPLKRYRDYYYATAIVTYSSEQDTSDKVIGLIGSVNFMIAELNSQIKGTIVDKDMQPVANAVVTLFDNTIIFGAVMRQTSTDAAGNYSFSNVDNGISVMIRAMSSNGAIEGALGGPLPLNCNQPYDSLRAQVVAERIMMTAADDVAPYVIDISPVDNADVAFAGFQAVFTFSEPIRQTPYTRTDLGVGHGTIMDDVTLDYNGLKKSALELPFTGQWNGTFTQLTISSNDLVGSAHYAIDFTGAAANLEDVVGNGLVNNPVITGDFEVLTFTTDGGSALPGAPVLTRRLIPGLYGNLDFFGGTVSLSWPSDPNARSYNVYRKSGSGSMELLIEDLPNLQYDDAASPALVSPYNGTSIFDPLQASPVQYVVRGVSRDLGLGPVSNTVTVSDAVAPQLSVATQGAAIATNLYPYTLNFTEPLIKSAAMVTSNYTFSNTSAVNFTIQQADYLGWQGASYVVRLTVATSAVPVAGTILTVGNSVTDINGNAVDNSANSQTF
ncbi:MAG TPA: carboxypeptidase regulatory-like domain-containing protein [Bacteroidota bacterium]